MKYTIVLAGFCAVVAAASPTPNATSDLAEQFNADNNLKTSIQNANPDALQDLLEGTCFKEAGDRATTSADKPKRFEEILLWIWCGQCREQYQKCMDSWACWLNPEACAITCQCDVLRWKPDCKACGYRC